MKKYILPITSVIVLAMLYLQTRMTTNMNAISPLTNDAPWQVALIIGGVALVAVVILVVMSIINKKNRK